jgi:hypothetical protein
MAFLVWIIIVGGTLFMIWYGYGLLVRKPGVGPEDGDGPTANCHLCRRSFPISRMVSRDKIAGFVNYFCGDCIEALYEEYTGRFRDGNVSSGDVLGKHVSRN